VNTKLPVKKIYKTAGFYNYSYFFTLFKKNTGLTPNQFRLQKAGR
jgi:YesN/AraC family two-component response regulator